MPGGVNDMDLLLNDLSLHGQFPSLSTFQDAIGQIMAMRKTAGEFNRKLYAHRNITNSRVSPALSLFDALQSLPIDTKRAVMPWLTQRGPFWEDIAEHSPNHWLECGDEIVTDTAVGEAAYCATLGIDRRLVSFAPSNWEFAPVRVTMRNGDSTDIAVPNFWQPEQLTAACKCAQAKPRSWNEVHTTAAARFQNLTFSVDCFERLNGQPFDPGAADRILGRLHVLNQLMVAVDDSGQRTPTGHRIYQDHFTGDRAWFSDSSDTEKSEFRGQMTFPHPERPGEYIFCPWHGKINNPPFRIHFYWPERPGASLYVVFIGLKITRR